MMTTMMWLRTPKIVLTTLFLGLLALGSTTAASEPNSEAEAGPIIDRIDVNVVNLEVFVTDKKGRPVIGLNEEDFQITVDGQEVPVSNFYAEEGDARTLAPSPRSFSDPEEALSDRPQNESSDPPKENLRLIVFVDQTALQPLNRKRSFKHVRRFLSEGMDPGDEVAIVSLAPGLRFHTDFSLDRQVVGKILEELEKRPALDLGTAIQRRQVMAEIADSYSGRPQTSGGPAGNFSGGQAPSSGSLAMIRGIAATEYSIRKSGTRALTALMETLGGVPGRKALLHVSDGISTRPGEDLFIAWQNRFGKEDREYQTEVGPYDLLRDFQEIANQANTSNVTFYALDAAPATYSYGRSAEFQGDSSGVGSVSTGVTSTYEANKRATLELAALETGGRRIIANGRLPHQLKRIGSDFHSFYSLGFTSPSGLLEERHEVEVQVPGHKGLVIRHQAGYSKKKPNRVAADKTMAALLYGVSEDTLGVAARRGSPELREDGTTLLPLEIDIPFDQLALLPDGNTRAATLSLFVTVQDETGATRPVQRVAIRLRLKEENVDRSHGRMAHYVLPVLLNPNDRRIALGVRDDVAGVVSTLRVEVDGALEKVPKRAPDRAASISGPASF